MSGYRSARPSPIAVARSGICWPIMKKFGVTGGSTRSGDVQCAPMNVMLKRWEASADDLHRSEVCPPRASATPWSLRSRMTVALRPGSSWSSTSTSSISHFPSMPPASLMRSAATCAPWPSSSAMVAWTPVNGRTTPILTLSSSLPESPDPPHALSTSVPTTAAARPREMVVLILSSPV